MKQENRTPLNKSRDLMGQEKIYFQIKYWLGVVVVGLVVGLSIQFVVAWGEPNQDPPSGGPIIQGGGGGVTGGCQIYIRNTTSGTRGQVMGAWGKGCRRDTNPRSRVIGCGMAAIDGYECGEIINLRKYFPEISKGSTSHSGSICLCVKSSE